MKKISLLVVALMLSVGVARAQVATIPMQGSSSAEGSHVFSGTVFNGITITWAASTTARYLMIFDATALPGNGATTSCTSQGSSPVSGCLALCMYLNESTIAPNRFTLDYTSHPFKNNFGVVAALSSNGSGCSSLTVDGSNNFFYSQVRY